jgi:hypothetical protein
MVMYMMGYGKMIEDMDKVRWITITVLLILVYGWKVSSKGKVSSYFQMEITIKGNGNLARCMEKAFSIVSMDLERKVFGNMANF